MIKKRNLDPSLIQWIMSQTGLGPGIGELHWVAPEMSATSQYRTQLQSWGVEQSHVIHTLPSLAYTKTIAGRNDVVCVLPGTYSEEETLTWENAETHMLAVGNPVWRQGGKCRIQTTTEAVGATIDVTGSGVHFGGFNVTNNADYTTNLTALRISATYFSGRNLDLRGQLNANQISGTNTSSLEFAHGLSFGFGSTFDTCHIGTASQTTRTGKNGVIRFAQSAQSGEQAHIWFKNCEIQGRAETATIPMVRQETVWGIGRGCKFENCHFYNFWQNKAGILNDCFWFNDSTTLAGSVIQLIDCTGYGIDEWDAGGNVGNVQSNNGNAGLMYSRKFG